MLRFVFPRLFGSYKEGSIIVGKFTVSGSGLVLTPVSGDCHPQLTAAVGVGTGQYVVSLAGGARKITVVNAYQTVMDEDDAVTDGRLIFVNSEDGIVAGTGTIPLTSVNLAATQDEAVLVDTAVLVVILYVDK